MWMDTKQSSQGLRGANLCMRTLIPLANPWNYININPKMDYSFIVLDAKRRLLQLGQKILNKETMKKMPM